MNSSEELQVPDRIALLTDTAVAKYLSRGIQTGEENPPYVALGKTALPFDVDDARRRTGPLRELVEQAMSRFEQNPTAADGWLAPRLHATLRLTRAEAADNRLWNFVGMLVAPDYLRWRHGRSGMIPAARFSGPHYTQAFARLWWAAELFRDGEDYRPVEIACRVQDVLNTTLRLDVIDHRPTAMAIVRIVAGLLEQGASRIGDRVNALSSTINTAASTLVYDVIAPDDPVDDDALRDWIIETAEMAPVPWDRLPTGPGDGVVSKRAVDELVPLFEELLANAPLRARKKSPEED